MALATEKNKDVDKNSCWNNQATEYGNNYDIPFFTSIALVEFCIKWNIIVVIAFGLCFYQEVLVLQIVQIVFEVIQVDVYALAMVTFFCWSVKNKICASDNLCSRFPHLTSAPILSASSFLW